MKDYEVYIYDEESGCCQPIVCKARSTIEAGNIGDSYIRSWNLIGGVVVDIREVTV